MTNEEMLKILKATFDTSASGLASPQDSDSFISMAVDQSGVLGSIRNETGIITSLNLDNLQFGEPFLVSDTEGAEPAAADVVAPTNNRKSLTPVECIAAFDVTFSNLRRNIMKNRLNEYLNQEASKRVGKDSVLVAFSGDTTLDTSTRTNKAKRILNGFITQAIADSTVHDVTFNKLTEKPTTVFGRMLKALPKDYADQIDMLGYYVSTEMYLEYAEEIGARQTAAADLILFGPSSPKPLYYMGIPIYPVYGQSTDYAELTIRDNLAVGYGQEMTVGRDIDNRAGLVKFTIRLGIDAKFVLGDALVLATHSAV